MSDSDAHDVPRLAVAKYALLRVSGGAMAGFGGVSMRSLSLGFMRREEAVCNLFKSRQNNRRAVTLN